MKSFNHITAIILAGGKSLRMGKDKGLVEFEGKPLVQYMIDKAGRFTDSIIIITNQPGYERFGFPCFEDIIKHCGPLGGVYTGLTHSETEKNLVLSCDIPLVPDFVLKQLLLKTAGEDVLAPRHDQKIEPLCAVYDKRCLDKIKTFLKKGDLKMQFVLQKTDTSYLDVDTTTVEWFLNVNTPDELKKIENKLLQ